MDCPKARYFLVASFDEPLSEADQKDLSYHLKDCRACRHESFYYRELFSGEKQLPVLRPASDFNERLLSEIRLREARSAWPQAEPLRRPFRWPLVYVPAIFGAVAAFSFMAFLPDRPAGIPETPALSQSTEAAPPPQGSFDLPVTELAREASRPRYVLTPRAPAAQRAGVIFEWPLAKHALAPSGDPFSAQLVSQSAYQQYMRMRARERYVLPVVSQTPERDRIY